MLPRGSHSVRVGPFRAMATRHGQSEVLVYYDCSPSSTKPWRSAKSPKSAVLSVTSGTR